MIQLKDLSAQDQERVAAKIFAIQEQQRAVKAEVVRILHTKEGQQALQRAMRPRGVNADGSLYRSSAAGTQGQLRCGCAACLASLGPLARGYRRLR